MNTSSLRAFGRQTVIPALGIIVMVLSLIDTGYQSSVRGLDLSWHAMLGYAHAHNLQHGRDLLFNYGPLSFMESAIYFEKNHADVLLLRGLYALTLGLCFFCVLRIRRVIDLLLFCALALFLVLLHDVYLLLPALLPSVPCGTMCRLSPSALYFFRCWCLRGRVRIWSIFPRFLRATSTFHRPTTPIWVCTRPGATSWPLRWGRWWWAAPLGCAGCSSYWLVRCPSFP